MFFFYKISLSRDFFSPVCVLWLEHTDKWIRRLYYYSLHRYKLLQRQKRSSNSSLPDVIVQMSLYIQSLCTFSFPPSCDLMSRDFHFVFRFFLSFEKELKSSRFWIFKTRIEMAHRFRKILIMNKIIICRVQDLQNNWTVRA